MTVDTAMKIVGCLQHKLASVAELVLQLAL